MKALVLLFPLALIGIMGMRCATASAGDDAAPATNVPAADEIVTLDLVKTADDAVRIVVEAIGLKDVPRARFKTDEVTFSKQSVPFVRQAIFGQRGWRIRLVDLVLEKDTQRPELKNKNLDEMVVLVAARTTKIVKVVLVGKNRPASLPEIPPCIEEEDQLRSNSTEYTGFPNSPPKITFAQALERADQWTDEVTEVCAYCITETTVRYKDRAVWIVDLRGIHPYEAFGDEHGVVHEDSRNHFRTILDCDSGEFLYGSSIPQPIDRLQDRL